MPQVARARLPSVDNIEKVCGSVAQIHNRYGFAVEGAGDRVANREVFPI
jgi:hypothetical protein